MVKLLIRTALLILTFQGCSTDNSVEEYHKQKDSSIEYAEGFDLEKISPWFQKITIINPYPGAESEIIYYLISKDNSVPDSLVDQNIIRTPVTRIAATSTTHIPLLEYLDASKSLVGFPTLDYISSRQLRQRIDSGKVRELGKDSQLNMEVLVELQPEMLMTYMLSADESQNERIHQAGIPVMINADYLEHHPLGRAEWIKVMGALLEKGKKADSVFSAISRRYKELKIQAELEKENPTVLTGIMYGDTWYLPGGGNYAARLFEDAGMVYPWNNVDNNGFLELNFETVYDKAGSSELWVGAASFNSLNELEQADSRYTWFEAFKNKQVYTYNKRIGPTGGNEYLELGYLRPDIVLADLIQIAHDIPADRELYFYKKLSP